MPIGSKFNGAFTSKNQSHINLHGLFSLARSSVTRLGDLLHFEQLFKACGNNYFAQIAHICSEFL